MDTLPKIYTQVDTPSSIFALKSNFWMLLRFTTTFIAAACIFFSTLTVASAEKLHTAPESSTIDFFVEFKPGNYQQPINSSFAKLIRQLHSQYANHQITLVGKSESRRSLATQQKAVNRAQIIKKLLVKKGFKASQIVVSGEYKNLKNKGDIQHGVLVLSSPAAQLSKLNSKTTKNTFVEFLPSQYKQAAADEIQRLIKQINHYPDTTKIKILGVSESKTNLATENLALTRARTVARGLISGGISAKRLKIDAKATNQIESEYLTHGAYIYIYTNDHSVNKAVQTKQTTSERQALNTIITAIGQNKQQKTDPIKHTNNSEINLLSKSTNKVKSTSTLKKPQLSQPSISTGLCSELTIKKGSLKTNIQREIADCGYLMGDWNFGTDEELIDWLIPIAYSVKVDRGIFGLLELIEKNYQIRAHVHQLDKSIDFLVSIKRDRRQ